MRPKSMATVVLVFRSVWPPASSMPTECSVIAASVDSGSMSEIEPMKGVFPPANPPATTILTVVGAASVPVGGEATSERGNAIENTLQNAERGRGIVRRAVVRLALHAGQALVGGVGSDAADDADGEADVRRELGDGHVLATGELEDPALLRRLLRSRLPEGAHERLDRQDVAAGPRAAARHRVRADRALLVGELVAVRLGHSASP